MTSLITDRRYNFQDKITLNSVAYLTTMKTKIVLKERENAVFIELLRVGFLILDRGVSLHYLWIGPFVIGLKTMFFVCLSRITVLGPTALGFDSCHCIIIVPKNCLVSAELTYSQLSARDFSFQGKIQYDGI